MISSGILIGLILVNYNFFHESIGWDYGNGSLYFLLGLVIFSGSKYVELIQGKIHERLGNWGYSIGFVMILGLLYKGNQTLGMSNFSLGTIAWVIILVLICYKEMV
ncbi:hypothetical protein IV57_GL000545 [Companilactobacillus kimchiensis]|uniref:Uncharacterized protein n=1 Tax=Companilactobacillus kimchiensis TaxID=993692 RepID=A0A0R2LC18_9LACO|nr:hypothetical protein IV57_GL000545 [Companilactobacillus kimchiensis]